MYTDNPCYCGSSIRWFTCGRGKFQPELCRPHIFVYLFRVFGSMSKVSHLFFIVKTTFLAHLFPLTFYSLPKYLPGRPNFNFFGIFIVALLLKWNGIFLKRALNNKLRIIQVRNNMGICCSLTITRTAISGRRLTLKLSRCSLSDHILFAHFDETSTITIHIWGQCQFIRQLYWRVVDDCLVILTRGVWG